MSEDNIENLPSIEDYKDNSEELPSVDEFISEEKELPSVEDFIQEEKEDIEEEVKTDNWKDDYIPTEIETQVYFHLLNILNYKRLCPCVCLSHNVM